MQYLLLIYEAEEIWENKTDAEKAEVMAGHQRLSEQLNADGVAFDGQELMPTSTAVSLHHSGGNTQITDGPFAETKEQLGGFYIVDVPTMEDALRYAAMIPNSGTTEVRPVVDHSEHAP